MKFLLRWLLALILLVPAIAPAQNTKVSLIPGVESIKPGETFLAGIEFKLAPGWHTYWRNPGGPGFAAKVKWDLPQGITAGDLQWPLPEKVVQDGETFFYYSHEVVLLVPLQVDASVPAGPIDLKGRVDWLECEKICVPGRSTVSVRVVVGDKTQPDVQAAKILATWQSRIPRPASVPAQARWEESPGANEIRHVLITFENKPLDFFPYTQEGVEAHAATEMPQPGTVRVTVKRLEDKWPTTLNLTGVLVQNPGTPDLLAVEVTLPVSAATATSTATTPGTTGASKITVVPVGKTVVTASPSLWRMLLFAFIGGLILNVMPCVLPVIALKILGFVNQGQETPTRARQLGLVYAAGVLVSFLVLAGLVIGVQQAGHVASWGMQFSNPHFILGLTVLVTLVALNLFGVFEINLGASAMNAAGGLSSREGFKGAFFNGILATVLATPCTAPFLGAALGYAFAQPAPIIVLMFLAIGVGLALPYVLLAWHPAWLRFLPKPGAWMVRFKVAMGFPMLATGFWILTIASEHFRRDDLIWLGLFLILICLAAWIWGEFVQRGSKGRTVAMALCVGLVGGAYFFVLENQLHWRNLAAPAAAQAGGGEPSDPHGIAWQPWSAEAIQKAREQGHPVLVDFTANWCLTCKSNKRFAIEIPSVQARLKEIGAVTLKADNTFFPENIALELKRFGRAGVPLVLVYSKDPNAPPVVLPEILTPNMVLEALAVAAKE